MSTRGTGSPSCAECAEDLASVALGIVSGRRREEVLAHVEGCPTCAAELEGLSVVADNLLALAPEIEPPWGFESRLARRLRTDALARRHAPRRRVLVAALAAIVLLALGIGAGALATRGGAPATPSATSRPVEARLTSGRQVVGDVIVSSGSRPWVVMTIDSGPWSGSVTCEVVLAGGKVLTMGTFRLADGYGAWGYPLSAPRDEVRGARLVSSRGVVLARAAFRA